MSPRTASLRAIATLAIFLGDFVAIFRPVAAPGGNTYFARSVGRNTPCSRPLIPRKSCRHGLAVQAYVAAFPKDPTGKILKCKILHIGRVAGAVYRARVVEDPSPTPGTGKVVRIDGKNKTTEIATGLFLPTAMTLGPDGNLYVSNVGFGPPPAELGQVVKITLPED